MPAGHPPTGGHGGMPAGHPPTGGHGGMSDPRFFKPPRDVVAMDKELPKATVDVRILDADNRPLPNAEIVLTVLTSSVTKGESREALSRTTDERGHYVFRDLATGTGISYAVKAHRGEATFVSQPFGLKDKHGVRVMLHAYEPNSDIDKSSLVIDALVVLELKEDAIAINHRLQFTNLGRQAFVAKDVFLEPPKGFKGFDKGEMSEDAGIKAKDGRMQMFGTFPPGTTEALFHYQVPLTGGEAQALNIPLPPNVFRTQVLLGASKQMGMEVAGFEAAQRGKWNGKRVLAAGKTAKSRGDAIHVLEVKLSGLPTPGPARWLSLLFGFAAVVGGAMYLGKRAGAKGVDPEQLADLKEARDALLGEFALLERAQRKGDVGPRSYARLRSVLLDALARIVSRIDQAKSAAKASKRAARSNSKARASKARKTAPKSKADAKKARAKKRPRTEA